MWFADFLLLWMQKGKKRMQEPENEKEPKKGRESKNNKLLLGQFVKEIDVDFFEKCTGYPHEWMEENNLSTYICNICFDIVKGPAAMDCGHFFCRGCLTQHVEKVNTSCPMKCDTQIQQPLSESKQLISILSRLTVTCFYRKRGCMAKPTLGINCKSLIDHVTTCPFRIVFCKYCANPCYLQDKDVHETELCEKRIFSCVLCREEIPHTQASHHMKRIPEDHTQLCANLMKCPLACKSIREVTDGKMTISLEGIILRSELLLHTTSLCPNSYQKCRYCKEQVILHRWKAHMEDSTYAKEHISLLLEENARQEKEIQELKKKVEVFSLETKRRKEFSTGANAELEAKYLKLMEERTPIFAKDCNGEWASAFILEILPFNNVRVRFPHYGTDWDTVINTMTEEYKLALDAESIPPFLQENEKAISTQFYIGQEVWAAYLYNGAQGTHLMKGTIQGKTQGQIRIKPTKEWSKMKRPNLDGSCWFHLMEIQDASTWKTKTSNNPEPQPVRPRNGTQLELGELTVNLFITE